MRLTPRALKFALMALMSCRLNVTYFEVFNSDVLLQNMASQSLYLTLNEANVVVLLCSVTYFRNRCVKQCKSMLDSSSNSDQKEVKSSEKSRRLLLLPSIFPFLLLFLLFSLTCFQFRFRFVSLFSSSSLFLFFSVFFFFLFLLIIALFCQFVIFFRGLVFFFYYFFFRFFCAQKKIYFSFQLFDTQN